MREKKTVLKFEVTLEAATRESPRGTSDSGTEECFVFRLNGKPIGPEMILKTGANGELKPSFARSYFDYIVKHLEEDLLHFLGQHDAEALFAAMLAKDWGDPQTTRNHKRAVHRLVKAFLGLEAERLKSRFGANAAIGGRQAKWTPERRAGFLELYEETLGKLKVGPDSLPDELAQKLKMRGGDPLHEIARERAAQIFAVPNNSYLIRVLTEARRQREGQPRTKKTKADSVEYPKRRKTKG